MFFTSAIDYDDVLYMTYALDDATTDGFVLETYDFGSFFFSLKASFILLKLLFNSC